MNVSVLAQNGAQVVEAVRGVQKVWEQIEALVDVFAMNLRRAVPAFDGRVSKLSVTDGDSDGPDAGWVYERWHWNYVIAGGGESRKHHPSYLALDFVLHDDVTEKVIGNQPVVYVLCCSDGEFDDIAEEVFRLDASFLREEGWKLDADGKLWTWTSTDGRTFYWVFCVPLLAINDEQDVRNELVLPAIRLIEEFRFKIPSALRDLTSVFEGTRHALAFELNAEEIKLKEIQES